MAQRPVLPLLDSAFCPGCLALASVCRVNGGPLPILKCRTRSRGVHSLKVLPRWPLLSRHCASVCPLLISLALVGAWPQLCALVSLSMLDLVHSGESRGSGTSDTQFTAGPRAAIYRHVTLSGYLTSRSLAWRTEPAVACVDEAQLWCHTRGVVVLGQVFVANNILKGTLGHVPLLPRSLVAASAPRSTALGASPPPRTLGSGTCGSCPHPSLRLCPHPRWSPLLPYILAAPLRAPFAEDPRAPP